MFSKNSTAHNYDLSMRCAVEPLLREHQTPYTLKLLFGVVYISVQTNSSELAHKLATYYQEFIVPTNQNRIDLSIIALEMDPPLLPFSFIKKEPDPGKHRIKEEYADIIGGRIVRKLLTGMVFIFGGGVNVALGPCTQYDNQVINFINNRYIEWMLNHGYLLGHAAAVEVEHCGIAIAGVAGAGKSTLALKLMEREASFVSNDRVLVQGEGRGLSLVGVPKLPRVNPGTLLSIERLKSLLPETERIMYQNYSLDELWEVEHKYDVSINRVYGSNRFKLFSTLDILIILTWHRRQGHPSLRRIDAIQHSDLISLFIKPPGLFYEPELIDPQTAFSQKAYVNRLQQCAIYEMSGGIDFDRAADLCCQEALQYHGIPQ